MLPELKGPWGSHFGEGMGLRLAPPHMELPRPADVLAREDVGARRECQLGFIANTPEQSPSVKLTLFPVLATSRA